MKEKLGKKIVSYALILVLFCVVASTALSLVYRLTKHKIAGQKELQIAESRREVLKAATKFVEKDDYVEGYNDQHQLVGKVIKSVPRGYAGPIEILVGIGLDNKICGIKILSQTETPGLGNKIVEEKFLNQLLGKTVDQMRFKKEGGEIDAISGATISSQAVVDGVREALKH